MKIFHDDVRPPPLPGWEWCRTNQEVIALLEREPCEEISLDHDLGYDGVDVEGLEGDALIDAMCLRGQSEDTGMNLVHWMIQNEKVPPKVRIHSWNPDRARDMARALNDAGYDCIIEPFRL